VSGPGPAGAGAAANGEEGEHDRGLQAERTELAWVRTALVCAGLTTAMLHVADGATSDLVAVVAGLAVGGAGVLAAALRMRTLRRPVPAPPPRSGAALLAACVVAADALTLALMLA
jgi:uncharacterized membrane protein YidH (DUF202 family)